VCSKSPEEGNVEVATTVNHAGHERSDRGGSGGIVAWWMVGRSTVMTQPALTAQEFVLRDGSDHIGAKVGWENGQPGLRLFDQTNQVRSALFLEPNGVPELYLYDSKKVVHAARNLFDSGVPNLAFVHAAG
jgi:hypothetical protein